MLTRAPRVNQRKEFMDERLFYGLHAPRQVDKTTSMMALAEELTASGK